MEQNETELRRAVVDFLNASAAPDADRRATLSSHCPECGFDYRRGRLSHSCVRKLQERIGISLTALKLAQTSLCEHLCMKHEELPTSHHPDCQEARDVLRALQFYILEKEG